MNCCVSEKIVGAHIKSDGRTDDLWEGDSVTLHCEVTSGTYVSYEWFLNNAPVQLSDNTSQKSLTIQNLSDRDSGEYACVASNVFNGTDFSKSTFDGLHINVKGNAVFVFGFIFILSTLKR